MPTYNYKARELIAKVVYYGPGRCGKTTNLQQIHAKMRPETRSELMSVATETDRTIYFDLLPLNLGTISGMKFMVRLFTVPGQVYYSETRKLVLRGADGVVFVADSQDHMADENRESLQDLKVNLAANGLDYSTIPFVLQYNKRDLPRLIPEAELDSMLNERGARALPAIASNGQGVVETLRAITVEVFNSIKAGAAAPRPTGAPAVQKPRAPSTGMPAQSHGPAGQSGFNAPGGAPRSAALENALAAARGNTGRAVAQNPLPPAPRAASGARLPPPPGEVGIDFYIEEFKNLAVMQAQFAERLASTERDVQRLSRENQQIRELLTRGGG
jgi:signal recognition particle receptor subunit beta